jgi:RNA polymerase sigma-70 factor (ECF subfamily)
MTLEQAIAGTGAEELEWDAVYADHAPRVYNYFRFRLGREADVEDLTARTFERAWRSRAQYRRDLVGFSTWLFKIAQNVRIDFLKSQRGQHLPINAAINNRLIAQLTGLSESNVGTILHRVVQTLRSRR